MSSAESRCGAPTKAGGTCQNLVAGPGKRCRVHRRRFDGKQVLKMCIKTANAAILAHDFYVMVSPHVLPLVHKLQGLLMPEHFWLAYEDGDLKRMKAELRSAQEESSVVIRGRFEHYSDDDKARVVATYEEIMRVLERHKAASGG